MKFRLYYLLLAVMLPGPAAMFAQFPETPPVFDWVQSLGGSGPDKGIGIASNRNYNDFYLTGTFSGSMNLQTYTLQSTGSEESFVARFQPDGNLIWLKQISCSEDGFVKTKAIASDADGNVYVTGYSRAESIDFEGATITSTNGQDLFLAKYDPDGNLQWAVSKFMEWDQHPNRMAVDNDGNCYILYAHGWGESDRNSGTMVKYDPDGNEVWNTWHPVLMQDIRFRPAGLLNGWDPDIDTFAVWDQPDSNFLYVPGSYQDDWVPGWPQWDPTNRNTCLYSRNNDGLYEGYLFFYEEETEFKLNQAPGWYQDSTFGDPDPGGQSGILQLYDWGGNNIKVTTGAGYYLVRADFNDSTYTTTRTEWGLIGSATPGGWDTDQNMIYDPVNNLWTISIILEPGLIKFRANDDWTLCYGDNEGDGILEENGSEIIIAERGMYTIRMKLGLPDYTYDIQKTPHVLYVSGEFWDTQILGSSTLTANNNRALFYGLVDPRNGEFLWADELDDPGPDITISANDMQVDSSGNVYLAGLYTRWIAHGYDTLQNSTDNARMYLVKFDSLGLLQYMTQAEVPEGNNTWMGVNDLCTDEDGHAWVFGWADNVMTAGSDTLPGSGNWCIKYDASGSAEWLREVFSGDEGDVARAGSGDFMITSFMNSNSLWLAYTDSSLTQQWQMETEGDWGTSTIYDISHDSEGNLLVTGTLCGYHEFLDTTINDCPAWFVFKTDPSGTLLWSKYLISEGADPWDFILLIDPQDNIYVGGNAQWGTLRTDNDNTILDPAFLLKLDPEGNTLWHTGGFPVRIMTFDSANNILVSGVFDGERQIGADHYVSNGLSDAAFTLLDKDDGSVLASHSWGDEKDNIIIGLTCDPENNLYAVVHNTIADNSTGYYTMIKFDSDGNELWSKQISNDTWPWNSDLEYDPEGYLYLTGSSEWVWDEGKDHFSVDTIDIYPVNGSRIVFLSKFDLNGKVQWVRHIEADWWLASKDLERDDQGNLYICASGGNLVSGDFCGVTDCSKGIWIRNIILKYSPEGDLLWMKDFANDPELYTCNLTLIDENHLYIGTTFNGTGTDYEHSEVHTEQNVFFAFLTTPPISDTAVVYKEAYGPASLVISASVAQATSFKLEIKEEGSDFQEIIPSGTVYYSGFFYYLLDSLNENTTYIIGVTPVNQVDTGLTVFDTVSTRASREMVAYLDFENDCGGYVEEVLSGRQDMMINAGIEFSDNDSLGNAIAFYGANASLSGDNNASVFLDSAFYDLTSDWVWTGADSLERRYFLFTEASYSFWFRDDDRDLARNGSVLTAFGGNLSNGICLYNDSLWAANGLRMGQTDYIKQEGIPFTSTLWNHVTWVYNKGLTTVYLNGEEVMQLDERDDWFYQSMNTRPTHWAANQIGSVYWLNRALDPILPDDLTQAVWHHPFEGMMDELKVFNYALDDNEVMNLYASDLMPVVDTADIWTEALGPNSIAIAAWTENADRYLLEIKTGLDDFAEVIPAKTTYLDGDYLFLIDSLDADTEYILRATPMNAADTGYAGYDTVYTRYAREMVAYLKFDEDYGGYVKEELSGNLDSMIHCSIVDDGISGKALRLEPVEIVPGTEEAATVFLDNALGDILTDYFLGFEDGSDMTFTEASYCFWFRNNDPGRAAEGSVLTAFGSDLSNGLCLYKDSLWVAAGAEYDSGSICSEGSIPFASTDWNHLVWVFDQGTTRLYLNGEKVIEFSEDSYFWQSFSASADRYASAQLGSVYWHNRALDEALPDDLNEEDYHHPFDGWMDEFRVYNYALTQQEIDTMYTYLTIDSVILAEPLCYGGSSGSITLLAQGGVAPLSYSIDDGVSFRSDSTFTGLTAGIYPIVVKDATGLSVSTTETIAQPDSITLTFMAAAYVCSSGSAGSIDLTVSGGVSPYTFIWSTDSTTEDINGLFPGTYFVTLTDQNACQGSDTVALETTGGLSVSLEDTLFFCYNESIVITGPEGYAGYLWSSGQVDTSRITAVTAGDYWLRVTDVFGCSGTDTVRVIELPEILTMLTPVDYDCHTGTPGSLDLTVSGGTAPYTLSWSTGETTEDISGLVPGSYYVAVTDQNGCQAADTGMVEPAGALAVALSDTIKFCFSDSALLTGPAGYAGYLWSSGQSDTSRIIVSAAGSYWLQITDVFGCAGADTTLAVELPEILTLMTPVDYNCATGSKGSIDLTVSGGKAPFYLLWSTGATAEDISDLLAGDYSVTTTDDNGCTVKDSLSLANTDALIMSMEDTVEFCPDGSAIISGPEGFEQYEWSTGETDTSSITVTSTDLYWLKITDIVGCNGSDTSQVIKLPAIVLSSVITDYQCSTGAKGSINLTVSGGTAPFTFLWSDNASTEDLASLHTGNYSVIATDNKGCAKADTFTVSLQGNLNISLVDTVTFCDGESEVITAPAGYAVYQWSNGTSDTNRITVDAAGMVILSVTDSEGCENKPDTVRIIEYAIPAAPVAADKSVCYGGVVPALAATGTSITWYLPDNTPVYSGSPFVTGKTETGRYTYLVSQTANDCESPFKQVTLSINPTPAKVSLPDTSICVGDMVRYSVTEAAGHSYLWIRSAPADTVSEEPAADLSPTSAGNYMFVELIDSVSCTSRDTFNIQVVPVPDITYTINTNPINAGGTATINLSGANSYAFIPNTSLVPVTASVFNSSPAENISYTVTGTSAEGCKNDTTIDIYVNCAACSTGNDVISKSGTINHGCANRNYLNSANCSWLVSPFGVNEVIMVFDLQKFDIKPGDKLSVYIGNDAGGILVGTFNNNSLPPDTISGFTEYFLHFQSDAVYTGRGFQINYNSISVGIPAVALQQLRIYPNPNNGTFTLEMDGVTMDKMEAEIFSTLGQKVWNRQLQPVNGSVCETIEMDSFPKGMYYIRIITREESYYRTVVIE